MSNVASTLLPFLATMLPVSATMSNEISSFRQCRNKLNMTGNIVAKNTNNVEATFDFVERTKFYNKIVRHCCRCGRGLTRPIVVCRLKNVNSWGQQDIASSKLLPLAPLYSWLVRRSVASFMSPITCASVKWSVSSLTTTPMSAEYCPRHSSTAFALHW